MRNQIRNSRDARKIVKLGVALAAIGVSLYPGIKPAWATPSGLITVPSTDIYREGNIHLDLDYLHFPSFNTAAGGRQSSLNVFTTGLQYGLGPDTDKPFGRTEIGFDFQVAQTGGFRRLGTTDRLSFNAKTQLYNDYEKGVRVVIGASGLGTKTTASNFGYITGSKNFGPAGRVHLGFGRAFNDRLFGGPGVERNVVQFGYERLLSRQLRFIAEYGTGKSGFGNAGASLVYYLNNRSNIQLAALRPNQRNGSNVFYYLGYDLNFARPTRAEAAPETSPEGEARK